MKLRGYWTLAALCLIFLTPMLLAWYVYKHPNLLHGHTNQGQLLNPTVQFSDLHALEIGGREMHWQKNWTVLYLSSLPCAKECQAVIYKMQQVRTATGKQRHRVNRLVLFKGSSKAVNLAKPDLVKIGQQDYVGTLLAYIPPELLQGQSQSMLKENKLYLVDPLGNIMLSYPADVAPNAIFKDLQHLLRISQIG